MRKIYILITLGFTSLFFGQAQTYHDTQGKLEVTNSGQSTYTLPIALPPSIQDVGPTINLTYSSGQLGGIAGPGWNISGVSTISRIATRKDIDGFVDGVDYDAYDKLALDGQRLLLKTGSYLMTGSTYETEVQSNTKIEMIGTYSSMEFVVTTPDGSRSWYHGSKGCQNCDGHHLNTTFYIYKYEDANGNVMEYKYTPTGLYNHASNQYLKEIYFSKNNNGSLTFLNKIKFGYLLAARAETSYIRTWEWKKYYRLNYVEVYTNLPNDALFRKYDLVYTDADYLGYERLQKITESNGAGEQANPIEFEYDSTGAGMIKDNVTAPSFTDGKDMNSGIKLSGDFNGDNRLDIAFENLLYMKSTISQNYYQIPLPFNISERLTMTGNSILNNKIIQHQSLINVNESLSELEFKVWGISSNTQSSYNKTVSFNNSNYHDFSLDSESFSYGQLSGSSYNNNCFEPTQKSSNKYLSGDFNGDGISEVLIISKLNERYYFKEETIEYNDYNESFEQYTCTNEYINDGVEYHIIDLNPTASTTLGTSGFVKIENLSYLNGTDTDKKYVQDFNGDGKDDILIVKPDLSYKIITFNELLSAPWVTAEIIGQGSFNYSFYEDRVILFGDFNGDGKTDIMHPNVTGYGCQGESYCKIWHIYYSNPRPDNGTFFTISSQEITDYIPYIGYNYSQHRNSYYAIDTNKDGKTDLVRFEIDNQWNSTFNHWNEAWRVHTFLNVIGKQNSTSAFINDYVSNFEDEATGINGIIPFFGSFKFNNNTSDFMIFAHKPTFYACNYNCYYKFNDYYTFTKNTIRDNTLVKITQSGGANVDEITYQPMISSDANLGQGLLSDFYSTTNTLTYPFMMIRNIPSLRLVSRVKNQSLGVTKYQDYKYHGFLANTLGLGAIGFSKTARSTWYRTTSDKKTWNVTQADPSKRGAIINSYSQLLNGNIEFTFTNNPISTSYVAGLINKSENTYYSAITDVLSKRYTLLLQSQKATDYLTNVINDVTYGYSSDGYYLPSSVISKNYIGTTLQGTTTTTTLFDNVTTGTGSGYYIGRPSETTTTVTAYGNSHTTNEKLFYTNGNLIRKEKKVGTSVASIATATETLIEIMDYFPNGNLKLKTVSSSGFPVTVPALSDRTLSYTYDETARFIKTTTTSDGVVSTNDTYHPIYGVVTQQTNNTLDQITKYEYDNWGKKTKMIDYLNKYVIYGYYRMDNIFKTLQTGEDNSRIEIQTDMQGRELRKINKNIDGGTGSWSYVDTEYDWKGRKYRESNPYFLINQTPMWTYFFYDDYDRLIQTLEPTTRTTTIAYVGLSTKVNDGTIEKITTKNANGHLVSSSDNLSGTINYTYDATGNMLTSGYDGSVLTMTYDLWGRKKSIDDPSGGIYSYDYNAYGEVIKESTPKGYTEYTYTPSGKVATKRVRDAQNPINTDILSTYTYHPTLKWLTNLTVTNPYDGNSNYVYSYDYGTATNTKQLKKIVETLYPTGSGTISFTKEFYFDGFGRVLNEVSTATAHGKTSTKTTTNTYRAGKLYQIFDGTSTTGVPLWQASYENERGQIKQASYGNGVSILNDYDELGFPTKIKHDINGSTTINVMTHDMKYDIIKANLTSRTYSELGQKENFYYDNLNRLEKWNSEGATLVFSTFSSGGLDGFTPVLGASVTNNAYNNLRINSSTSNAGAEKKIMSNATIGKTIKITGFNFTESASGNIYVGVYEKDPVTQAVTAIANPIELTSVSFDFEYKVTTYSDVYIKFYFVGTYAVYTIDEVKVVEVNEFVQSYHDNGRIDENKLGTYNYNKVTATPSRPYQNTSITLTDEGKAIYGAKAGQLIGYNAIQRPIQIAEGSQKIDFGYNGMQQRMVMYYGNANTTKSARPFRKYYSFDGSMEIEYTLANSTTTPPTAEKVRFLTYIGGDPYSAPLVIEKIDNGTTNNFYLHRDYLGSIVTITNNVGGIVERRVFDPWGEVIKVQDGAGNNLTKLTFFDRGYTGHEHLQAVGLINMNARLYDPKLHRLLQPDNFIQNPTSTQDYNRYAYAHNNPTKYIDPDGNNPILIGMGIALASYFVGAAINHQKITVGGITNSIFWGFMSSAISFGVGEYTQTISTFTTRAVVQSVAHGVTQGGLSSIQGGKFWNSFASGSISSLAASGWSGGNNLDANGDAIAGTGFSGIGGSSGASMIAFSTISGGAGAALTGGNFWQGAVTGLVVSGLNHSLHGGLKANKKFKEFLKEYYAIVAGESSNNITEAQGIGEVILRRIKLVGAEYDGDFISKIGGADQYDAVDGDIYNEIKGMSLHKIETMAKGSNYYNRIEGAKNAFFSNDSNVSNGAYIWNATSQKNAKDVGFNWRTYNRGTYEITAEIGGTTFFKYSDVNHKQWP